MNILDLIIFVIFIGALIRGFQLGLIRQMIHLLSFFIAVFMAYRFSGDLTPYVTEIIPAPQFEQSTIYKFSETFQLTNMFYNAISFMIIFFVTKIVLHIGGGILHQIASLPGLAIINRFSGAVVGGVQAILIVLVIVHAMTVMPYPTLQYYVDGSQLAHAFIDITPFVTETLYHLWDAQPMTSAV